MTALATPPKLQFLDANGAPLVGGKLYTYVAGTTTPQVTYTDFGGGTANANPVILDSRGEASVWLGTALYKMALYSATNVLIWTVDNIGGFATLAQLAASGGSALVGYLPAGTGAVATTVQAKLRESVSAADFGASPLASASVNRAAVQAAIDAMYAAGGGTVLLADMYDIDASLLNKAGVSIVGLGRETGITATGDFKIFQQNTGLGAALNMSWKNFLIKGPATSYIFAKEGFHAINLFESENVVISEIWFEDIWGDGVYVRTNKVRIENVHCKNCYRQGIAVTDGDYISINGIRGEGTMITLVDIEPNAGDQINYLQIDDVVHVSNTIPALRLYHSVATNDVINNVTLSNITTKTLGIAATTNLVASNILSGSTNAAVSLDLYYVKNAEMSNIVITGAGLSAQTKLKATNCENVVVNGVVIEGGAAIDIDFLGMTNCSFNDLHLDNCGNIGVRLRDSTGVTLNSPYIDAASTYAFYLVPTTSLAKTRISNATVENSAVGLYASGTIGNLYIDGDFTGATTPIQTGAYTGQFYYGTLLGVTPLTGTKAYTITAGLADGAGETTTVTVTGAVLGGGFVDVWFSRDLQGITMTGYISATNTVSVRFQNESGGPLTIAAGTLTAWVRRTY
jgi:hypothetical protein